MESLDYSLIDSGDGRKLEKFGPYILDRPDPQIIWKKNYPELWSRADAVFEKDTEEGGKWVKKSAMPSEWLMGWEGLQFWARLTPFKHTGIFPEQQSQWFWTREQIAKSKSPPSILNLFGYTGLAALNAAYVGARVTHVDASHSAVTWARQNQAESKLADKPIRWILEDVMKFVSREARRGAKYDGLIMDPPAFGHGPKGETWQFNKSLPQLLEVCQQILSPAPRFVIINAYAISTSALTLGNVLADLMAKHPGDIQTGELVLKSSTDSRPLSTGIWGSWACK